MAHTIIRKAVGYADEQRFKDLTNRVKIAAARLDVSMKEFILDARESESH